MLGDSLMQGVGKSVNSNIFELNFFSILYQVSKRMTVFLSVPETFIYGFGFDRPTLMCSDIKNNELCFEENLSSSGIHEGFVYFKEISQPNFPVAVYKTQTRSHDKCDVLFTVKECQTVWDSSIKSSKNIIIQRYVYSGKVPKLIKSDFIINEPLNKVTMYKKNTKITEKVSSLLPGLKRTSTMKIIEERACIIRQKEICQTKEIPIDYTLQSQIMNLTQVVEKFYSSSKNCKVEVLSSNWICDKKENYYFISLKSFKLLNIVYKPLQMKKSSFLHSKSSSMQLNNDYIVIARMKKQTEPQIRYRSSQKYSRSMKKVNYSDASRKDLVSIKIK